MDPSLRRGKGVAPKCVLVRLLASLPPFGPPPSVFLSPKGGVCAECAVYVCGLQWGWLAGWPSCLSCLSCWRVGNELRV